MAVLAVVTTPARVSHLVSLTHTDIQPAFQAVELVP